MEGIRYCFDGSGFPGSGVAVKQDVRRGLGLEQGGSIADDLRPFPFIAAQGVQTDLVRMENRLHPALELFRRKLGNLLQNSQFSGKRPVPVFRNRLFLRPRQHIDVFFFQYSCTECAGKVPTGRIDSSGKRGIGFHLFFQGGGGAETPQLCQRGLAEQAAEQSQGAKAEKHGLGLEHGILPFTGIRVRRRPSGLPRCRR